MTVYCYLCEAPMVYRDTVNRNATSLALPAEWVDVFDCTDPNCNNVEEL